MRKNFFDSTDTTHPPPIPNGSDGVGPHELNDQGYWDAVCAQAAERFEHDGGAEKVSDTPPKPSIWKAAGGWSEEMLPRRPWVVPGYMMRGSVSVVAGAGSAGKSSMLKGQALGSALGMPFHKFRPPGPLRVLTYNCEDDLDEERRRLSATCRQFGIFPDQIPDTLMMVGPEQVGTLITHDPVSGYCVATQAMTEISDIMAEFQPDIVILDPLVELHTAEENDNTGLRAVVAHFRNLARHYNCAIVIIHHTRKGATVPGDPDAVRGASSVVGAARVVFTVCTMTEDEAGKLGVPLAKRRLYFRVDGAKMNYAPIDAAEWFQRVVYTLENGEEVAAAEPWDPPSPWDGVTWDMIDEILATVEAGPSPGEFYAASRQSKARWVGNILVDTAGKTPEQAATIIKAWIEAGVLTHGTYQSPAQRGGVTNCLRVNATKLSEMRLHSTTPGGEGVDV